MTKYKVYEVEERSTPTGKELKKCVLQGEGLKYPDKNVTVWEDFPNYRGVVVGATIEGEMQKTPSKSINPRSGQPYVNKTLVSASASVPTIPPQTQKTPQNGAATKEDIRFLYDYIKAEFEDLKQLVGKEAEIEMPDFDVAP